MKRIQTLQNCLSLLSELVDLPQTSSTAFIWPSCVNEQFMNNLQLEIIYWNLSSALEVAKYFNIQLLTQQTRKSNSTSHNCIYQWLLKVPGSEKLRKDLLNRLNTKGSSSLQELNQKQIMLNSRLQTLVKPSPLQFSNYCVNSKTFPVQLKQKIVPRYSGLTYFGTGPQFTSQTQSFEQIKTYKVQKLSVRNKLAANLVHLLDLAPEKRENLPDLEQLQLLLAVQNQLNPNLKRFEQLRKQVDSDFQTQILLKVQNQILSDHRSDFKLIREKEDETFTQLTQKLNSDFIVDCTILILGLGYQKEETVNKLLEENKKTIKTLNGFKQRSLVMIMFLLKQLNKRINAVLKTRANKNGLVQQYSFVKQDDLIGPEEFIDNYKYGLNNNKSKFKYIILQKKEIIQVFGGEQLVQCLSQNYTEEMPQIKMKVNQQINQEFDETTETQ
ncbi:Hypothetical_protein [Hexamita inflata]|uniref:Hypothetical_protein n=1 Tax=Hexamita inflata TaxID=28002 RepID=A0AA86TIH1_9EUKA|nr:Hypothetical protein HINF_LOCUS4562 [Hexamita inflata]